MSNFGARGNSSPYVDALLYTLINTAGGREALTNHLAATYGGDPNEGDGVSATPVDENTPGYCYLRLLNPFGHNEAKNLGAYPSAADVRRFTNARADPFGAHNVQVTIDMHAGNRVAHIIACNNERGLKPIAALSALAKECKVGGYPFGEKFAAHTNLVSLEKFNAAYAESCGHTADLASEARENALVCVPNDLPFNIPDPDRYPYSRYAGLQNFTRAIPYNNAWDFALNLGAKRDQTPTDEFWKQAFPTGSMLSAYFRLLVEHRQVFTSKVSWVRDPLPGRPGGVQVVPPEWPGVIPTPIFHTMTRYAGIADWVQKQEEPWQVVCRMALFGIHEPFDPIWWADYHKTVDVYIMYTRLSPALRDSFSQDVYWIPDGTPNADSDEKTESEASGEQGFCYLKLFRPAIRPRMRRVLGSNPWGNAVVVELLRSPNSWSQARFQFTVAGRPPGSDTRVSQGHVEESSTGLPVYELISLLFGAVRLGATNDLNALMDIQDREVIAAHPTVFPTNPIGGGAGMELSFNMFGIVGKDTVKYPSISFDIIREPLFTMMLGVYESVHLISATFSIDVSTGAQNGVYAAICGPTTDLVVETDWLATPINMIVFGSDQGRVHGSLELPRVHPFEKELRAGSSVGNPTPTFRFSFAGNAGATGTIKGRIVVRVRGQYALGHVRVGAPMSGKSLRNQVERLHETLPEVELGVTRAPGDEEPETSDEETIAPKGKTRAPEASNSPPKANGSAVRTVVK